MANEQRLFVDESRLALLATHVMQSEDIDDSVELSILLVTEDHIKQLNRRFANEDRSTDVLAFPMMEDDDDEENLLGDVVVCPPVAQRQAASMNHSLERELDVLTVHGTLHLLGYDHQTPQDKTEMDRRTDSILDSFIVSAV
ncbi:MAG: rRNA maturation RNase YbeY [Actinomycetota bacterium]|nr:rRNA maturation RNase YbeY [Actinomycetota bacterium]